MGLVNYIRITISRKYIILLKYLQNFGNRLYGENITITKLKTKLYTSYLHSNSGIQIEKIKSLYLLNWVEKTHDYCNGNVEIHV